MYKQKQATVNLYTNLFSNFYIAYSESIRLLNNPLYSTLIIL